jgi:AcrR family transcriptional regulator
MEEIAEAAGSIAVTEGLAQVTAKKVADAIGVYPGLVNHYFRSADELAAAAFAAANTRHRAAQAAVTRGSDSPTDELRAFLHYATASAHDSAALMWLDAWRESQRRPALQREVIRQMEADLAEVTDLLERGVAAAEFRVIDCAATAMRILAMIDGTFAQAAVRTAIADSGLINYPSVTAMLLRTAEHELALAAGILD